MMTKLKNVNFDAFGIGVLYELLEADDEMEKIVDLAFEQGLTKVLKIGNILRKYVTRFVK